MDYVERAHRFFLSDGYQRSTGNREKQLDSFLLNIYQYYSLKGLSPIILSEFCKVISLAFTVGFGLFLIGFLNWDAVLTCKDEESCEYARENFVKNPFYGRATSVSFFLSLYFMVFTTFWIYNCAKSFQTVTDAFQMERFYREILGIKLNDLHSIQWCEIVHRLTLLHNHGTFKLGATEKITAHSLVLRIMRKDNYLIALINKNLLDLFVPWWISPFASEKLFLTKSLEWSLSFCILEYMFNDDLDICSDFLHDVSGLQWRFQVVGLINFILLPFMLVFMTINFFLQNAQQFHSNKAYLGPRQWSPLAIWKFREFNELPHVFEDRINRSYTSANAYVTSFRNPYIIISARCVAYISGALVATLLLISFVSEGMLLYGDIWDHNLLWYLGIFSAVYATARSLVPDETEQCEHPNVLLQRTCAHIHSYPESWFGRAASLEVRDEFSELFQFKAQIFLMEVLSVVLTPLVLCFSLPECAHSVLHFIRDHSKHVDGLGAVCDYSLFDFEQYGDEDFGVEKFGLLEQSHRPNDGKMEKSYLNFKQTYPDYQESNAAKTLIGRLAAFKDLNLQKRDLTISSLVDKSLFHSRGSTAPFRGIRTERSEVGIAERDKIDPSLHDSPIHTFHQESIIENEETIPRESLGLEEPRKPLFLENPVYEGNLQESYHEEDHEDASPLLPPGGFIARSHHSRMQRGAHRTMSPPRFEMSTYGVQGPLGFGSGDVGVSGLMDPMRNSLDYQQQQQRSVLGSRFSTGASMELSNVLLSVLKQENIDFENDFYWLAKFNHERMRNPQGLERSLTNSQLPVRSRGATPRSPATNFYHQAPLHSGEQKEGTVPAPPTSSLGIDVPQFPEF